MHDTAFADLHIHTTYSDGKFTPEQILRYAAKRGIQTVAFTDHDNASGYRAGLPIAQRLGIELIPAIEFTCHWPHCDIPIEDDDTDVLGYFINVEHPAFLAFEQTAFQDVCARMTELCERLTQLGYPMTLQEVLAENPHYPGGLHLAHAFQRKGYASEWQEVVQILHRAKDHLRSATFSIYQAIELVHEIGGIAILAHPTTLTGQHNRFLPEHLTMLVEMGLDGLELYHPRVDASARRYLSDIARQFKLLVSGGTDQHGWKDGLRRLGKEPITPDMVAALRARHAARQYQKGE